MDIFFDSKRRRLETPNLDPDRRPENPTLDQFKEKIFPKYWVMAAEDSKLTDVSPFALERTINQNKMGIQINSTRNGSLLIKCNSFEQTEHLQTINNIMGRPIKVSKHRTMNSTQAIIKNWHIKHMPEEEITAELREQHVTNVKRFQIKKDNKLVPINTYLLTFENVKPPKKIMIGYVSCEVIQYTQSPMRCKKCQKFNHTQKKCEAAAKCYRCGLEEHGECQDTPKCVNCKGPHTASSKDCPKFKKEEAIQQTKATLDCTYFEAKKIHQENEKMRGKTYADMTKKNSATGSTQTDASTQTEAMIITQFQQLKHTTGQQTEETATESMYTFNAARPKVPSITANENTTQPKPKIPYAKKNTTAKSKVHTLMTAPPLITHNPYELLATDAQDVENLEKLIPKHNTARPSRNTTSTNRGKPSEKQSKEHGEIEKSAKKPTTRTAEKRERRSESMDVERNRTIVGDDPSQTPEENTKPVDNTTSSSIDKEASEKKKKEKKTKNNTKMRTKEETRDKDKNKSKKQNYQNEGGDDMEVDNVEEIPLPPRRLPAEEQEPHIDNG